MAAATSSSGGGGGSVAVMDASVVGDDAVASASSSLAFNSQKEGITSPLKEVNIADRSPEKELARESENRKEQQPNLAGATNQNGKAAGLSRKSTQR